MNDRLIKEESLWQTMKKDWFIFVLILAPLAIALWFYPQLPDKMPTHWDIYGNVDGYSSKAFAVFFFPLLNLGIYLLMVLAPKIDPRRENYARFGGAYRLIRIFLIIFLSGLYLATLLAGLGYAVKVSLLVKVAVSLLFIVMGNVMGKFRHNYFVGIKTPWTLANEEVWYKTHRFAGKIWVASGLVCLILSLWDAAWASYLFFAIIMFMAFLPMVVSYLYYRQLQE